MHGNTVGRHGRTTGARGARVRRHGRVRRTSGVRRAALTLILCVAALLLLPVNAYADTGLGQYLNNPAGASSVAYEYLTGKDWDDISHEGNSAPATALLQASTSGDYPSYAAFVDSLYHSQVDATNWYSRLEGLAFLNAASAARSDIEKCLKEHPLNGSGSGSGSGSGGNTYYDVNMTMFPNRNGQFSYKDSENTTWWCTGNNSTYNYKSEFTMKMPDSFRERVNQNANKYLVVTNRYSSSNSNGFRYETRLWVFDPAYWQMTEQKSSYVVNTDSLNKVYQITLKTRDGESHSYTYYDYFSDGYVKKAPWESFNYNSLGSASLSNTAIYINFDGYSTGYKSYNDTLGVGVDYTLPVDPPVEPVEPGTPDNPVTSAPTVNIFNGGTFDDSDIIAAIESLDNDLVSAVNNQNDYLRQLFQYINDDLATYFYTLDKDMVDACNWLKQEIVGSITDLDSDVNDGLSDVVGALESLNDDMNYYLYRLELLLNNIYTRLGNILEKMGAGGGGNTSSRPDPSDDGDGFLDWLLDLFQTGLEDLLDTLNLTGLLSKFNLLRQKFPFSIPWDIAAIIALFVHEPVTPVIDIPLPTIAIDGVNYQTLRIDLTSWQLLGQACRDGTFILFAFGLMLRTKSLLDGEKVS